jgi:hypothetical protein
MAKNGYHRKNVKQSSKANAGDAEAVFIAPNHIERIDEKLIKDRRGIENPGRFQ